MGGGGGAVHFRSDIRKVGGGRGQFASGPIRKVGGGGAVHFRSDIRKVGGGGNSLQVRYEKCGGGGGGGGGNSLQVRYGSGGGGGRYLCLAQRNTLS